MGIREHHAVAHVPRDDRRRAARGVRAPRWRAERCRARHLQLASAALRHRPGRGTDAGREPDHPDLERAGQDEPGRQPGGAGDPRARAAAARPARPYSRERRVQEDRPDGGHQPGQRLRHGHPEWRTGDAGAAEAKGVPVRARMKPLTVAVDVGTTGARAAAFSLDGRLVTEVRQRYRTRVPRPGWAEQDAGDWADGALTVLGRL